MEFWSFLSGLWAHSRSYRLLGHALLGLIDCGRQFHRPSRDHLQMRITSCRLRPIRRSSRWSLNIAIEKRQGSLLRTLFQCGRYGVWYWSIIAYSRHWKSSARR